MHPATKKLTQKHAVSNTCYG